MSESKQESILKTTKPVELVKEETKDIAALISLPNLEKYYPDRFSGSYEVMDIDQWAAINWLWNRTTNKKRQEVFNSLAVKTLNAESEKFKQMNTISKYFCLCEMGWFTDKYHITSEAKQINKMVFNGTLTPAQESELIQTHYYETLFRAVNKFMTGMKCVGGTITARTGTCRMAYEEEHSFSYTADEAKAKTTPGAMVEHDAGTYAYRDNTLIPYSLKSKISYPMMEDSGYDIMGIETDFLGEKLAYIANYQVEKKIYDSANLTKEDLADSAIKLSNVRTVLYNIHHAGYVPDNLILSDYQFWKGLLNDTAMTYLTDYAYGSPEPLREARIPILYNVNIYQESNGYIERSDSGKPTGLGVDSNHAGRFIQRGPPILESWRDPDTKSDCRSVYWKFTTGILYVNAANEIES
jgi:hypothetical protein